MAYQFYPQIYSYPQPQMQQMQQPQMQQQPMQQQSQQMQMQNGGFMVIPSEEMARTYPVAPGNCVTFKIEGKPIVMEKSMGFSQLEAPRIDKYRLVREEDMPVTSEKSLGDDKDKDIYNKPIEEIKGHIEEIRADIERLKERLDKMEDLGA